MASAEDERDADLAMLGLLHLKDKPSELKAALNKILAERERFEAEGEKQLEAIRARIAQAEAGGEHATPLPVARAPGRKTSTLLIASKKAGTCLTCRHANQGTVDLEEGHVYCQIDQGVKQPVQHCDVVRQLPNKSPIRSVDPAHWPKYFVYEPYNGENGTWSKLGDIRMLAEDADEALRKSQQADLPVID